MNVPLSPSEAELLADLLEVTRPVVAAYSTGRPVRILDEVRVMESFREWASRHTKEDRDLAAMIFRIRNAP